MRLVALFAAACLAAFPATAHEVRLGSLVVDHPWARATIGTARPGVAYVTIVNEGETADALVGVETPAAARVHIHETRKDGGMMRMVPLARLPVPAGGRVVLAPGGTHLMLMGLKRPLEVGGTLPLTLIFEKAGRLTVDAYIEEAGAAAPGPAPTPGMKHGGH